jgi:hypothetical protein
VLELSLGMNMPPSEVLLNVSWSQGHSAGSLREVSAYAYEVRSDDVMIRCDIIGKIIVVEARSSKTCCHTRYFELG